LRSMDSTEMTTYEVEQEMITLILASDG
jgi:hypothetical protein